MSELPSSLADDSAARSGSAAAVRDWTPAAVYTLGCLTLISAFNYLDRSLLGLALPAIKAEMHVSDTALGLVSGLAFVLFYSLLGVPIAWAADRWNRRNIIAVGFAFWSVMTALTGWVANVWQLALARFLMGAGEASVIAPSNSMISDVFRQERRPLALSIFNTAVSIAFILFFPALGWVEQHYGWRAMFVLAGAPGTALAAVFALSVREPQRGRREPRAALVPQTGLPATLRYLLRSRTYLALLATGTFMGLNVFAASVWTPTFLHRVHGMQMAEVAAVIGPLRGLFGFGGVLLGGIAVDRLMRLAPHWRVTLPAIACLLTAPAELLFLLSDSRAVWIGAFAASSFLVLVHQGPLYALVVGIAGLRRRAVAIAVLLLCSALLGQAVGPFLVGALNDWLAPVLGEGAIRYSMLVIVVSAVAAGVSLLIAARYVDAESECVEASADAAQPSVHT